MFDHIDILAVRENVERLPARERELAELLLAGHSQKSAAEAMRVSTRTVRNYLRNIRRSFAA